jgi:hypothetical protein
VLAGLNGPVNAMVEWDPDGAGPLPPVLVVGGQFTVAADQNVQNLAAWDGAHWSSVSTGVNNTVSALAVAPNNDLIVGGSFTAAGSVPANRIARWNGSAWSAYGAGLDNSVYSVAVMPNGDVVAGGFFTQGGIANRIARWNGSAWTALGTGMGPSGSSVTALLAMPNGDLIAGGNFTTAGGVTVNEIARWNGSTWSALGGGMTPVGIGGVHSLVLMPNGDIMAGGQFFYADGNLVYGIARWNGSAWANLRSGVFNQGQGGTWNGDVRSMVVLPNGDLAAAGQFVSAGGVTSRSVARWDGTDWQAYSATTPNYVVNAIVRRASGDLVVGGVGGVAVWNGAAWANLDGQASTVFDGSVTLLTAMSNGGFVAGGTFIHIGGATFNQLAQWQTESWRPLGVGMSAGGTVNALAGLPDGSVLVGGNFGLIGGIEAFNIARWDGTNWYALGSGVNGGVNSIAVLADGRVLVAGGFSTAGGVAANRLAVWNGSSWTAFGGAGPSGGGSDVLCTLVMPNGDLFIGGTFTFIDGVSANRIARWDGSVWHALSSGINNAVLRMTAFHGDVIATGQFTSAGGWPMYNSITRWNGSDYVQVPVTNTGDIGPIATLSNGDLLVGSASNGNGIKRWDGTNWTTVGTPGANGSDNFHVYALAGLASGDIVAGGDFTKMNGRPAASFARYAVPSADYNRDGSVGTDADIDAFFACLSGQCCPQCTPDFNGDGAVGTDADIEAFFRVLSGAPC